jgi:hypothetical protein
MARINTDLAIHRGRRLALVPTILLLASCSSPEQKIELATRSVRSWEATVRETSAALSEGAIPRVYARQVLRAARDHERAESRRPEWNAIPAEVRAGLEEAVHQLAYSERGAVILSETKDLCSGGLRDSSLRSE